MRTTVLNILVQFVGGEFQALIIFKCTPDHVNVQPKLKSRDYEIFSFSELPPV